MLAADDGFLAFVERPPEAVGTRGSDDFCTEFPEGRNLAGDVALEELDEEDAASVTERARGESHGGCRLALAVPCVEMDHGSGIMRCRSSSVRRSLSAVPLSWMRNDSRIRTASFRTAQGIGMPSGRMFETTLRSESTELFRAM